jgi:hypothetical protein
MMPMRIRSLANLSMSVTDHFLSSSDPGYNAWTVVLNLSYVFVRSISCLGSNLGAKQLPLLGISIRFAIGAITIDAGGGTGADIFAGPDSGLSGSSGDGDNELGVVTDSDGDRCDVVGKLRSGRFECLALSSGTGNKSKSEKLPSLAMAANILSRRFQW